MGRALAGRPRDQYVISTKVGRIILDEIEDVSARDLGEKGDVFKYGLDHCDIVWNPKSLGLCFGRG
jgi:D-threo-aldose 1-dehydrogenase